MDGKQNYNALAALAAVIFTPSIYDLHTNVDWNEKLVLARREFGF